MKTAEVKSLLEKAEALLLTEAKSVEGKALAAEIQAVVLSQLSSRRGRKPKNRSVEEATEEVLRAMRLFPWTAEYLTAVVKALEAPFATCGMRLVLDQERRAVLPELLK